MFEHGGRHEFKPRTVMVARPEIPCSTSVRTASYTMRRRAGNRPSEQVRGAALMQNTHALTRLAARVQISVLAWALAGCGASNGMPSAAPQSIDWLLPPGGAEEAIQTAYAHRSESAGAAYTARDRNLWLPRPDSPHPKAWGYWNAPLLSADIPKVQGRPAPDTYATPFNDSRAVYGILAHGIFWIGTDVQTDGEEAYGAGYDYLERNRFASPVNGSFLEVRWSGDALGMVKETGSPVSGPAVLTVTAVEASTYRLHLDVAFAGPDGDQLELLADGADGRFGAENVEAEGYRMEGVFLGPLAEEAAGIFETPAYYGAFGARRR